MTLHEHCHLLTNDFQHAETHPHDVRLPEQHRHRTCQRTEPPAAAQVQVVREQCEEDGAGVGVKEECEEEEDWERCKGERFPNHTCFVRLQPESTFTRSSQMLTDAAICQYLGRLELQTKCEEDDDEVEEREYDVDEAEPKQSAHVACKEQIVDAQHH